MSHWLANQRTAMPFEARAGTTSRNWPKDSVTLTV
jgi:hypothetical protein